MTNVEKAIQDQLKRFDDRAEYLSKKWDSQIGKAREIYEQIKGRPFPKNLKHTLAVTLDNIEELFVKKRIVDGTYSSDISFTNFAFDIVSALIPSLIAEEIVSVQGMDRRTAEIFFMNFIVDKDKGKYSVGDDILNSKTGWASTKKFASHFVEEELIGTGDGSTTNFTGTFDYYPMLDGQAVTITDGTETFTGTVSGTTTTLTGSAGGSGTVTNATGAFDITFNTAPTNGVDILATYPVNLEKGPDAIGHVKVELLSETVKAYTRKLNTEWLMDASFDLQKAHGRDAEKELLVALTSEVKAEIDAEIIDDLLANGSASSGLEWDKTPPSSSIPWIWHKKTIIDKFINGSSDIYTGTRRAVGNFLVLGTNVSDVVESLDEFKSAVGPSNEITGAYYAGVLNNRWKVYVSPDIDPNKWIQGYIGENYLKTGYVYAPYLPLFTTPTYTTKDFVSHKGLGTSFGKHIINAKMYSIGTMIES